MCGICGLVAPEGEPDPTWVDSMRARLRHRGPDQASTDLYGRCALGHQRLIVLDPATGEQPVANESGDVVAVFNGELYNFRELRVELAGRGHDVRGTGDSPVIPHLYEEHGLRFVDRLSGMFAIALWDARRERLVLARDRLGTKPLLFTWTHGRTLAFASELKALLELPGVRPEVNLGALDAYLALGYVPAGEHAVKGIQKVPPGHLLVFEAGHGHFRLERYWEPEPRAAERSDEEWLELVRETVGASVRRRLVADVPLGALLSGGIDSSVVVAEMAKAAPEPVRTFTVGFGDTRYDEREHARAVAERYGTRHEEVVVESDAAELLPQFAEAFDEPFGDDAALPLYVVCGQARRHVTVALTGDGGDEAFAGYERYFAQGAASRVPAPLARISAQALGILPTARREPRSTAFRAARFLRAAATSAASRYGGLMEVFPVAARSELWTEDARAEIGRQLSAAELLGPAPTDVRGLQLLDMRTYLPDDLLFQADIASMAHSLELRSPFLDHEVVELGLSLPEHLKLEGRMGKVALRRAFAEDLPPSVAARGKKGFGVPLSRWFRADLRELASDLLLDRRVRERGLLRVEAVERLLADHVAGRADHGQRLWTLLMLELWQRHHVERERYVSMLSATPS